MEAIYDMLGKEISVGDSVVYGKSDRDNPINVGVVKNITEEEIHILGRGNVKVGKLPRFHAKRVVVLEGTTFD